MILWREKFRATALHFLVTLAFAAAAAALVFLVWFPHPFEKMIGGTELFELVVGCDLALGPLISLVIYNSRKSRRALITDYTIVGVVQAAALAYGIFVIAASRPVYVAFNVDRLEIVAAQEISKDELAAAKDPLYRELPVSGPRFVGIEVPKADRLDDFFQSAAGHESHMRPRFYAPYESQLEKIRSRAKPVSALEQKHPASKPLLEAAVSKLDVPAERLQWVPVHHAKGFWTALIDTADGKPVAYIQFDPY